MSDQNAGIIEEFRENEGRVGGVFEGATLLLLHHRGARTGIERVSPLMYQEVDNGYAVFASKAGSDSNPDWYYNLEANPDAMVEVGTQILEVRARAVEGEEYDRIWSRQKRDRPQFARYEERTARDRIPVIVLERV